MSPHRGELHIVPDGGWPVDQHRSRFIKPSRPPESGPKFPGRELSSC